MYSATLTPHLGGAPLWKRAIAAYFLFDQTFALFTAKYDSPSDHSLSEKMSYFLGAGVPLACSWYVATLAGALLSEQMPTDIGIEFAVPITFLAVVAPMLKSLAQVAASVTSMILVLALSFMPFGTGLLVAALAALIVGSLVEVWTEKQTLNMSEGSDQ